MTATIVTIPQWEIDAYISKQDLSQLPVVHHQAVFLSRRIRDAGFEVGVLSVASGAIRVCGCRVVIERNNVNREVRVLIDREVAA
ncbi:hypothetical protein [Aeromonas veronii]|uniref:hypothetical protein n=1 Tax=Aeromonas veronii TaxID=654 RepID=UPI001933E635|nr:hypothetical protein [Aeromonas veronii]MBM0416279.1 hypothetical protein [Aeromonas veronii]MBW3788870.1 hypothetical protein [Aeromonas veronii]